MTKQLKSNSQEEVNWDTVRGKKNTERNRAMAVVNQLIRPLFPRGRQASLPFHIYHRAVLDLFSQTGADHQRIRRKTQQSAARWLLNEPWILTDAGINHEWVMDMFHKARVDINSYL